MDAITFIKEKARMCAVCDNTCKGCEIYKINNSEVCAITCGKNPEEVIRIVSEWSAANPVKTYKTDFFAKFPNAPKGLEDAPMPCKQYVYRCDCPRVISGGDTCIACWNQPLPKELGGQS